MQDAVQEHLKRVGGKVELDASIGTKIPWRPHVVERDQHIGWQLHPVLPDTETWLSRIERSIEVDARLRIGVATTEESLRCSAFLLACQKIGARLLVFKERRGGFAFEKAYASVPDFVCEEGLKLDGPTAKVMLDQAYQVALRPGTKAQKGVALEMVAALLLSQVDNFEISNIGISNRTQQMDVLVHSRAVGGVLGASPIILAEAKNWKAKVTPTEYAEFIRKLETRHRRAKLGFLVTTGKFTSGVAAERRRDSRGEALVVLLDGVALQRIWGGPENITKLVERAVLDASVGD